MQKKESIDKAEDREKFDQAMKNIGLETPRSSIAHSLEEALQVQAGLGFPVLLGPLLRWVVVEEESHTTKRNSKKYVNEDWICLQLKSC